MKRLIVLIIWLVTFHGLQLKAQDTDRIIQKGNESYNQFGGALLSVSLCHKQSLVRQVNFSFECLCKFLPVVGLASIK